MASRSCPPPSGPTASTHARATKRRRASTGRPGCSCDHASCRHDGRMTSENGFLETNGARIYYEVTGSGPAAAFIHAGVANLRMWDEQVAALSDAYRVIRYDTRGFGRTETQAVPFSNRADVAALLDHLGERQAHVVGLSRGGHIALDFALECPDRVRSLTIAAGGVGGYR